MPTNRYQRNNFQTGLELGGSHKIFLCAFGALKVNHFAFIISKKHGRYIPLGSTVHQHQRKTGLKVRVKIDHLEKYVTK